MRMVLLPDCVSTGWIFQRRIYPTRCSTRAGRDVVGLNQIRTIPTVAVGSMTVMPAQSGIQDHGMHGSLLSPGDGKVNGEVRRV